MESRYWFRSDKFSIEKGEDEETNPLCFGKSLANWLSHKMSECGYQSEVIPEDWGWCVMCESNGYLLWLGCGCIISEEYNEDDTPQGSEVVWHVFSHIEIPFFHYKTLLKKLSGKLVLDTQLDKLNQQLDAVLKSEPAIIFCDEP